MFYNLGNSLVKSILFHKIDTGISNIPQENLLTLTVPEEYIESFNYFSSSLKEEQIQPIELPAIEILYSNSNQYILYFHGNCEDINICYKTCKELSNELKINVLCVEYVGYNNNNLESSERGCYYSVYTGIDYLLSKRFVKSNDIYFMGRSLGSGSATHGAYYVNKILDLPIGGLILWSAFLSIRKLCCNKVTCGNIAQYFITDIFNNENKIKQLTSDTPVLLLHGKQDNLIPKWHSENLYNCSNSQKKKCIIIENSDHNYFNIQKDIILPIQKFLF